jgi:hypothetical protein
MKAEKQNSAVRIYHGGFKMILAAFERALTDPGRA